METEVGTFRATCTKAFQAYTDITVGEVYRVDWKKGVLGTTLYTIILSTRTHDMKGVNFMTHFQEVNEGT
ncbi:MAG: hypothetical protein WCV50_01325 [Patescibacteria group bacterium]|jgi:hypothetical protein